LPSSYLERVRSNTELRFQQLKGSLAEAERLLAGRACVYATGSFGRMEAGPLSDLDLFIVVETDWETKYGERVIVNRLDGIEEIRLKHRLIEAVETCGIAPFDGAGKYLEVHGMGDFVNELGSRKDDYLNTLTGRLLLLLESRPLLGACTYDRLLDNVISAYFRDYVGNESDFVPAFLVNDILRMWRTFAVNYELQRKKGGSGYRIKNLKLKYSRMITCYSAVMYLLARHVETGAVSPGDVKEMVTLTPAERLHATVGQAAPPGPDGGRFASLIGEVLDDYADFLAFSHRPPAEIEAESEHGFLQWRQDSYNFGRKFAEAVTLLGQSSSPFDGLYRIILI
jgi:predicted nucleotidyltransferase